MLQKVNDSIRATTVMLKGIEGEKEKKKKDKGKTKLMYHIRSLAFVLINPTLCSSRAHFCCCLFVFLIIVVSLKNSSSNTVKELPNIVVSAERWK